jgi:hypothetical protein
MVYDAFAAGGVVHAVTRHTQMGERTSVASQNGGYYHEP